MLNEFLIISFLSLLIIIFFWKKNYEIASLLNIFDNIESNRKIKKKKTPLTGGLIILSFIYMFYSINFIDFTFFDNLKYNLDTPLYFFFINLIFLIGFIDDKIDVSANKKLLSFVIIFSIITYLDHELLIDILMFKDLDFTLNIFSFSIFFVVFCLVVFLNAANMFDGINLQCSSYFLFLNIYLQLILEFDSFLTLLMIGLIFFMILNAKNKSYLGDSGVYLMATIYALIIIKLYNKGYLFCDQILLMMLIPGLDMIRLTFLRVFKGTHPFKADNNHIHHLLASKFNEFKVFLITFFLVVIPNFLGFLLNKYIIFILISLLIYFYMIIKLNNANKKI